MPYDFGNRLNWDLALRQTYQGRRPPDGVLVQRGDRLMKGGYFPIPDITLIVDSTILMIGVDSPTAKAHWRLGAIASMRLLVSPSSTSNFLALVDSAQHKCRLFSLSLVRFPELDSLPYVLVLQIPSWLEKVSI